VVRRGHTPEQIISKLREVEVHINQGISISEASRKIYELLNRKVFYPLTEAKVLIEQWRRAYNQVRPHSSLGYRPPAPEAIIPVTLT
jgi:transposase InsO family protein